MVSKEILVEVKKDLKLVSKYSKYWLVILAVIILTVFYNSFSFKLERQIIQLTEQKNYLIAENMQLRKEKAVLSSPKRVYSIATKSLKMKKVDYSKVHFIDVN